MVCIYCSGETHVINSRPQKRLNQVWRRRQCKSCSAVFSTNEIADYSSSLTVTASTGAISPFSRDKLFLSLYRSCQHRSDALSDASALTNTIIKKLLNQITSGTIPAKTIMQIAQVALNRFDKAASVHYQAFHAQ